jgi:DNA (cytosine-5)-methyltransferase 1
MREKLTCLDLFCGCGGLSLGLHRAGLEILAAIDFDPKAVAVYKANLTDTSHVLCEDLTKFPPAELQRLIRRDRVDVIAGGPPCQGFSQVRQRDGANNGKRLVPDSRRTLYQQYFEYVRHFRPKAFVMENVLGIRSAEEGRYYTAVKATARECGYRVSGVVLDASELGVPQKRRRQWIIGTRLNLPDYFRGDKIVSAVRIENVTLGDAIGDLPVLRAGCGTDPCDYDLVRRKRQRQNKTAARYLRKVLEIGKSRQLTAHVARPHSKRDLRDFSKLREGEHAKQALDRGEVLEFPYDRESFHDRYTRQHRRRLCSTIVAHLSKDGLMFIHPTQNRSLTPREAARVQSFPDWFQFPIARTHQFRVIGNAVPPLVGQAVGISVREYMIAALKSPQSIGFWLAPLPECDAMAVEWVKPLLDLGSHSLRKIHENDFKRAWYSIAFLYMGLHPDSALDHGTSVVNKYTGPKSSDEIDPRFYAPYFERSGWPLVLAPIAKEAWRRFRRGELTDPEFYCSEAQLAGICHRNSELAEEVRTERERLVAVGG